MARNPQLSHNSTENSELLGCHPCIFRSICGGLNARSGLIDCFDTCCGGKSSCDVVCPKRPTQFANDIREVNGLELLSPRLTGFPSYYEISKPPGFIPYLQHSGSRNRALRSNGVGLSLYSLFHRGSPKLKFANRAELNREYNLTNSTEVILSGTAEDQPIERWWGMGSNLRREASHALLELAPKVVTTPNYSLFTDQPRTHDLHSIRRIQIVWDEMRSVGLQVALHLNGRTDMDFERWARFLEEHKDINFVATELATGGRYASRARWHAKMLGQVANQVGRPLGLIIRGGIHHLNQLEADFESVHLLDTSVFMKSVKRQVAKISHCGKQLTWHTSPTPTGEPVDDYFDNNISALEGRYKKCIGAN